MNKSLKFANFNRIVFRATLSENSGICSPVEKLEYFSDYTFTNCMTERRYLQNPNWNLTCQLPIVTLVRWGLNMTKKQMDTGDRECSLHEILENIYNSSGKTLSLTDWQRNLRMAESNVCPPLCDSVIYTFNRVPTKNFQSSNDAAISLIFTESYHTHAIEVSALSSWDYLSLIGGTIGLYIGASLISILHICASLFLAFARSRRQLI